MRLFPAAAVFALLAAGCTESYTVAEVLADPGSLEGKEVRVRGWRILAIGQTLMDCSSAGPCCNRASGRLTLAPTRSSSQSEAQIWVREFGCSGNECEVTCSPFDPMSAGAFELVGTLRRATSAEWLLDSVDLGESLALSGGDDLEDMDESSLSEGTFTVRLTTD